MSEAMQKQFLSENLIAFGIALVVFMGLYFIKPVYPFEPHGIILPALEKLPPGSTQAIKIYTSEPSDTQTFAYVNVEGHTLNPTAEQQGEMVEYAAKLATTVGANGLIVHMGYEGSGGSTPAPLAKMVLFGQAIFNKSS